MSTPLFRKTLKRNYILWLIFLGIITLYMTVIINMYHPDEVDVMKQLVEMKISPELLKSFGFEMQDSSLTGFVASYYYGFIAIVFPMIFYIILSLRLVASPVDKGSIALILSTPMTRGRYIRTKLSFYLLTISGLVVYQLILGIVLAEVKFPGLLDMSAFIVLNLMVWLLHLSIASICFLSSCAFSDYRKAAIFAAGISILFFIMNMLANYDASAVYQYMTLISLFDPAGIVAGHVIWPSIIVYSVLSLLLYALSVMIFYKKDLSV